MKLQKGFTLIELMIVIAIIGILAAIALPAYQDYTVRSKISEGLNMVGAAKLAVAETYDSTGSFKANNTSYGLPLATSIKGNYVSTITATQSTITITYKPTGIGGTPTANGGTLIVVAATNAGSVEWSCTRATAIVAKYRPANCRP
jgi:type IV pilus assembly protein PilA